jgi:hypothetical protein
MIFMKRITLFLIIMILSLIIFGCPKPGDDDEITALNEDFQDGGSFYLSQGTEASGNNQIVSVGTHDACIKVHATATSPYGSSGVEAQFNLDGTDLYDFTGENYILSFDVYVPADSYARLQGLQYVFTNSTENYHSIYSKFFDGITADTWVHLEDLVDNADGEIGYSAFVNNPGDWHFDLVKFQFVSTAVDDDITFYIDNIYVRKPE